MQPGSETFDIWPANPLIFLLRSWQFGTAPAVSPGSHRKGSDLSAAEAPTVHPPAARHRAACSVQAPGIVDPDPSDPDVGEAEKRALRKEVRRMV